MSDCPPAGQLKRLEAGELSDHEADALLVHLPTCSRCAATLERLRKEDLDARVVRAALRDSTISPDGATSPDACGAEHAEHGWDIPDYERVRLCGEGAFGTVWAVRDRVGVYRALKMIDLERLRSLNAQCRESAALEVYCRHVRRHPNLIEIFHVGMQRNRLYYTMELADDDTSRKPVRDTLPENYRPLTLEHVIQHGPIGADTAIEVALRLLRGLSRLHALGLAHRDVKPANVIFVRRQPKLADIGMITANTTEPGLVGTPDYMPPDGRMDLTADTYALGRTLYELMARRAATDFPQLPREVVDSSTGWDMDGIEAVLTKACSADAANRFQYAHQMLEAIEACRQLPFESLFTDLGLIERAAAETRRSPYAPIAVAAINALPWVLLLTLALVIAAKLL